MHVLRHDDVTSDRKEIAQADALQRIFKQFHGPDRGEVRTTPIATEGEEVELPRLLVTDARTIHALRGYFNREAVGCDKGDLPPRSPLVVRNGQRTPPVP